MTNKNNDDFIDLSLLGLLDLGDEDDQEFALNDLIERHKRIAFGLAQVEKPCKFELQSEILLALVKVIRQFKPSQCKSLYLYIERELPRKLSFILSKRLAIDRKNYIGIIQDEINLIKRVHPTCSDFEIAKILQIPFVKGQDLSAQGNIYGYTSLLGQINNIQWLVLYNINQDDPEVSYAHLNHHLGLNIGHLKKIEWWAKYEIFEIIKEN